MSAGAIPRVVAIVASSCNVELVLARGCAGAAVFFGDVAQQVLLPQHPASQAFWLDTLEVMHGRAETQTGAATSVAAITTDVMIRFNMA
jgi:hypothetical protein